MMERHGPGDEIRLELTDEERKALDALPRERDPGRLLEERTVRALREEGLLAARAGDSGAVGERRGPAERSRWRLVAAAAAGIALFAGGLSIGQVLGARQTADAFHTAFEGSDTQLAARLQRAGSDYVEALAVLAEQENAAADTGQAFEVALTALWAAANEIVRLAPDDPLAAKILQGFEARSQQPDGPYAGNQLLVEF